MKLEQMKIKELSDTSHAIAEKLFEGHGYPWEVLGDINKFIESLGASPPENKCRKTGKNAWIHKTARMAPTAVMGGPTIIGPKVQIRDGAFLRGGVVLGQHVVIGSSCKIKNSTIFDEAQVSHFNYADDSILGYKVHVGAGAVTSNMKADKGLAKVHAEDGDMETGRKKFGVILDDHAETGCNSVLNPGTVIERSSNAYPLSNARGCVPSGSIYKGQDDVAIKEVRGVETEQEVPEASEKGKGGLKVVK